MTKKLVINADDFGFNRQINEGIYQAYKNGVVTSVSMMVGKEGYQSALNIIKSGANFGVGVHIDLDKYFYVDHLRGYVTKWIEPRPQLDLVLEDVKRQIETLLSEGIKLDHLSSHHHAHLDLELLPHICEIAKSYGIEAIRFNRKLFHSQEKYERAKKIIDQSGLIYLPHYIEGWYWGNIDEPFEVAELVTHPGYGEVWREYELSNCINPELKGYIRGKGIQLIKFSDYISEVKGEPLNS